MTRFPRIPHPYGQIISWAFYAGLMGGLFAYLVGAGA